MRIGGGNIRVLLSRLPIGQFQLSVFLSRKPRKKNGLVCSVVEVTFGPVEFWGGVLSSQVQSAHVSCERGFLGLGTSRKQDLPSLCFQNQSSPLYPPRPGEVRRILWAIAKPNIDLPR